MNALKRSDYLALAALIVLGFLLGRLQTNARNQGRSDFITATTRRLVSPAVSLIGGTVDAAASFAGSLLNAAHLEAENKLLRQQAGAAATYLDDVNRLQQEIDELRKLGGWVTSPGREKVPADVTGYFPLESRITINVGHDRGLHRGMPVATYEGLVGRVETVDADSSQVLLITSTSLEARISALVQRKAPNPPPAGLIRGEGPSLLRLELADPTAAVETGDTVVTAGFSDQIPRGVVIGRVISVQDDPAFGKRAALVFPRVNLGQVREVVVLK